jgi:hypothetical protein
MPMTSLRSSTAPGDPVDGDVVADPDNPPPSRRGLRSCRVRRLRASTQLARAGVAAGGRGSPQPLTRPEGGPRGRQPDALRDDAQAAVAFVTTEHFNPASARVATIPRPTDAPACSSARCPPASGCPGLRRPDFPCRPLHVRADPVPGAVLPWPGDVRKPMVSIVGAIGVINSVLLGVPTDSRSRQEITARPRSGPSSNGGWWR